MYKYTYSCDGSNQSLGKLGFDLFHHLYCIR